MDGAQHLHSLPGKPSSLDILNSCCRKIPPESRHNTAPLHENITEVAGHAAASGTQTWGFAAQADARGAGLLLTARQSRSARVQRADAGARSRAGARCLAAVLGPMRRAAEALEVQHPGEQEALLLQRRSLAALRSLEEAMAQRLLRARFRGEQPCAGRPPRNRRSEAEYRAHLGHAYRRARARPSDAALHAKKGW